jgi:hypothetical protein
MDFYGPVTLLEYQLDELEGRWDWIFNSFWEIKDLIDDIKEVLEYDPSPRPPADFDPFQTIF